MNWQKPYRGTQLNKSHPLARGLVGAWLMNEGSGNIIWDSVQRLQSSSASFNWVAGGIKQSGAAPQITATPSGLYPTGSSNFSLVVALNHIDSDTDNQGIFSYNSYDPMLIQRANESFAIYDGGYINFNYPPALSALGRINTAIVREGTGTDETKLYVDGVHRSSGTYAASLPTPTNVRIGWSGSASYYFLDAIYYIFFYNRALTASEIQQLYVTPYAAWESNVIELFSYVEAGGGEINWITNIQGTSTTPDTISQTIARALLIDITGSSTTPNIAATLARALLTDIQGSSATPSISQIIARALLIDIQGSSTTSSIGTTMARGLITDIQGSSTTSSIAAIIARALTADIQGSSTTPSVAAIIARSLSIDIQGSSATPDDAISSFTIFECDWEDGSDILNTGGTYEWLSETDVDGKLSEASDSEMWNRDYLYWNGSSNNAGYLTKALSTFGESGYRFGLNVFSEGLATSEQQCIFRVQDSGSNPLFNCYLYDNGSNLLIYFQVYDTGGTGRNTNGIILSLDTNYQVVAKLKKNIAGGFYFSVYQEDGTTQVGSEIQLSTDYTTRNSNAFGMFAGTIFASAVITEHGIDIIQVINSYDYPDTIQVGINWITNIQGASTTPDTVSQTVERTLLTDITGSSTTPSVTGILIRSLLTDISGASTTPDNIAAILARGLITDIQGASVTPSIVQTISRSLSSDIQGVSTTSSVVTTIVRALMADIIGSSTTAEVTVNIIRALITNIVGSSVTPDITISLEGAISWITNIIGSRITPIITADLIRGLQTNIQGQSITPDDVAAIWNEILFVADSTITSLTPIKTMESITPIRTIEEI